MKFMNLLITFCLWKCAPNFRICQKLLIGWHEGLIYKFKTIGVSDNLLTLIQSFLNSEYQRVLLMVKIPMGLMIKTGVP